MLRVELLGKLRVTLDDAPVAGFVSGKVQALLCYLVVTGRPHFRSALAALLWGEQSDAEASTNLRQALANLRRLLEPYLLITRQTVAFNRDAPYWLDVEQFAVRLAAAQPDTGQLCEATELYAGDFLEGFTVRDAPAFEEWALSERERLRQIALNALHTLAAEHTTRGEYAAGVAAATRLLSLDPWREETHRQLMLLLARSGQRGAALAQYEACRRVLDEALGVEPMPETTALYERIRLAAPAPAQVAPAAPLVGRERERTELARRLSDPACRLMTIVGPGGIGKTRLALQALHDQRHSFLHGAHFIPLASIGTADVLLSTLASAFGFSFHAGGSPKTQLFSYLRDKETLLVLDNFEQLVEPGAELVSELLRHAPDVKLLVTSRERLRLGDEWLFELGGLQVPPAETHELIETYGATQLFLSRAERVRADFTLDQADAGAVARICRLVEGLPLGIELAAAWVVALPCDQIAREIEAGLDFLTTSLRDVPERQRSLRAVFDHSLRLLSEGQRATFLRLAVFQGGFERAAAAQVADASLGTLAALVDKSLLRRNSAGRYELHEFARQYATEQLEARGEASQARDRHCAYYVGLLARQAEPLHSGAQQQAAREIDAEIGNVRAAWAWAVAQQQLAAISQAIVALCRFYDLRGWFAEGAATFEGAIKHLEVADGATDADERQILRGRLLTRAAWFQTRLGRYDQAGAQLQQGLALLRAGTGDQRREVARALVGQGYLAILAGDYLRAQALSREALALFEDAGHQHGAADALNNLGIVADMLGQYAEAKRCYEENLALYQALGDPRGIARALHNLADTSRMLGEREAARALHQECLAIARANDDRLLEAYSLGGQGIVEQSLGDNTAARSLLEQGLEQFSALGYQAGVELCLNHLGVLASAAGDYPAANAYFRAALQIAAEIQAAPEMLSTLAGFATSMARSGASGQAIELLATIRGHPACYQHVLEQAEQLLADLERQVAPEVFAQALARGKRQSLEQAVRGLLHSQPDQAAKAAFTASQRSAAARRPESAADCRSADRRGARTRRRPGRRRAA